jgi:hypothetical protein
MSKVFETDCPRKLPALVLAIFLVGLAPVSSQAVTLKGSAVLQPDPTGDPVSGEVTFSLPHHVWVSGTLWVIPQPEWVGEHTCNILAAETQDPANGGTIAPGNTYIFARLQRGRKSGSIFVGIATRRPDLSLFNAGCDGIPGNGDKFEGHAAALYAAPAVYLEQALDSTAVDPGGRSVRKELLDTFGIDPARSFIKPKLLEFHSFDAPHNPGGSAIGVASAQLTLKFRVPE